MTGTEETRWPIYRDREVHIRPDQVLITDWIPIETAMLGSTHERSIEAITEKVHDFRQMGDSQRVPAPRGHWDGDRFAIMDGGHTFIALQILGKSHVLVSWLAPKEGG